MEKAASKYEELREKVKEMRAAMKKEGHMIFTEMAKDFFFKYPNVESFGWRQYTPYFNDGDTCTFSVHADADYVEVNGVAGYDVEIPGGLTYQYQGNNDLYYTERKKALNVHNEVSDLLNVFEDEDMLAFFGDHTKVTVHRDGSVDTDDFEHD